MRLGFTGTQRGMTPRQRDSVRLILSQQSVSEVHHGDCVGADQEFDVLAHELDVRVVVHPPDDPRKRAFVLGYAEIREERPYLVRNAEIVSETDVLVATPKGDREELRSGTWATIRRARQQGKQVIVAWPDGRVEYLGTDQGEDDRAISPWSVHAL